MKKFFIDLILKIICLLQVICSRYIGIYPHSLNRIKARYYGSEVYFLEDVKRIKGMDVIVYGQYIIANFIKNYKRNHKMHGGFDRE